MTHPNRRIPARVLLLVLLGAARCGGDIELGGEAPTDGGSADAGPTPDASVAPDGGSACTPTYPATWPYPRDVATYRAKFYDRAAADVCTTCHDSLSRPLMPSNAARLDDPATLTQAIDDLWGTVVPGPPSALLVRGHSPTSAGGAGQIPIYSEEQAARYSTILRELGGCP